MSSTPIPSAGPEIISSQAIMAKYHESNIETILHTFKKIEKVYRNSTKTGEIYIDRKTRRQILVRWFVPGEGDAKEMYVTWLVHEGKEYMADRP
jgi:hypothetical protein